MSSIPNLNNLASIARLWRGRATGKKSFKFNWSTGYIQQVGYSWGVVRKQNDWSRDYWQCYWGYFNIWDSAVHGLDNRSVQTMKFVFQIDDNLNSITLASYNNFYSVEVVASTWIIQIYLPWTWSIQIRSTTTIAPWQIYCVVARINNTLPSWTARVIWDADIFINWAAKESKTTATLWNNATTTSILNRWANNATSQLFRWRLYNFSLWNRALSDAECQAEWLSNWSIVTPSGLVNTWDTTDTSQAISRTWYNLNVSGNVTTGTDADGKYILSEWNRNWAAATWTWTTISNTALNIFTEKTDFTYETEFKLVTNAPNNNTWIIWSWAWWANGFVTSIYATASGVIRFWIRVWGTNYEFNWPTLTLWQKYVAELKYKASEAKLYWYLDWTLLNSWWTPVTWAFTFSWFWLWDVMILWWTTSSSTKKYYRATLWARYLSDADSTAHRALGNNTNNDPTIVASYRPDNLINQQFLLNPTELDNASWIKFWSTSVTANNVTAPDWTMTADTVAISWTATQWLTQSSAILTWSSLASKTFIIKAFVKVATWTALFRLRCTHTWVTDYQSADLTATTTWQEFTFTQTFTSSTSWTWVAWAILNSTWATNPTLQVRNVRLFLVNEILYDNSPNIGWYVWPLTNRYYSSWVRLGADWTAIPSSQPILNWCYSYIHIRETTNQINDRYDDRIGARASLYELWTWFRDWVHIIGWIERGWTAFKTALWVNGVKVDNDNQFLDASHAIRQAFIRAWRAWSTYYNGNLRDSRFFTSPTALTDAQALMITNWGDPMDVTKVLHRDALPSDTTNYVTDKSGNGRVGYITWGVTKTF